MHCLLVLTGVFAIATGVYGGAEGADLSYGLQIVGKLFRNFLNSQPEDFKLTDGVHLISTSSPNDAEGRSSDDNSVFGVLENYLQTHEIKIKLPELMPDGHDFGRAFKDVVQGINSSDIGNYDFPTSNVRINSPRCGNGKVNDPLCFN